MNAPRADVVVDVSMSRSEMEIVWRALRLPGRGLEMVPTAELWQWLRAGIRVWGRAFEQGIENDLPKVDEVSMSKLLTDALREIEASEAKA